MSYSRFATEESNVEDRSDFIYGLPRKTKILYIMRDLQSMTVHVPKMFFNTHLRHRTVNHQGLQFEITCMDQNLQSVSSFCTGVLKFVPPKTLKELKDLIRILTFFAKNDRIVRNSLNQVYIKFKELLNSQDKTSQYQNLSRIRREKNRRQLHKTNRPYNIPSGSNGANLSNDLLTQYQYPTQNTDFITNNSPGLSLTAPTSTFTPNADFTPSSSSYQNTIAFVGDNHQAVNSTTYQLPIYSTRTPRYMPETYNTYLSQQYQPPQNIVNNPPTQYQEYISRQSYSNYGYSEPSSFSDNSQFVPNILSSPQVTRSRPSHNAEFIRNNSPGLSLTAPTSTFTPNATFSSSSFQNIAFVGDNHQAVNSTTYQFPIYSTHTPRYMPENYNTLLSQQHQPPQNMVIHHPTQYQEYTASQSYSSYGYTEPSSLSDNTQFVPNILSIPQVTQESRDIPNFSSQLSVDISSTVPQQNKDDLNDEFQENEVTSSIASQQNVDTSNNNLQSNLLDIGFIKEEPIDYNETPDANDYFEDILEIDDASDRLVIDEDALI